MVALIRFLYGSLRVRRGLGRLVMILARYFKSLQMFPTPMVDGRILYLDLREVMCLGYLLDGQDVFEKGETAFVRSILRPGDIVIDAGANVGWYTTLFSELVGTDGRVYAFEPNEKALRLLRASLSPYPQASLIPAALGSRDSEGLLRVPRQGGRASLSAVEGTITTQTCPVTTFDGFLEKRQIQPVTFVKCDVEGGELDLLRGAARLLQSEKPPMWMIEINPTAAARFGYKVAEIFACFERAGSACFRSYCIHPATGVLEPPVPPYERFPPAHGKYDAVFVPAWLHARLPPRGQSACAE
jgi:FkbM family methyltransferase